MGAMERISVLELREYWDAIANLKEGERIEVIYPPRMPSSRGAPSAISSISRMERAATFTAASF
jgi:hypothetical protein